MISSRALSSLSRVVLLSTLLGGVAAAQIGPCPTGSKRTQASCGNDTCECAPECDTHAQCPTGCCYQGFCAVACVCNSGGTETVNDGCETAGCGASVAPVAPGPGTAFGWGLGLFAVGALGFAGAGRRARRWKLGAALVLCLLGGGLIAGSMFGTAPLKTFAANAGR